MQFFKGANIMVYEVKGLNTAYFYWNLLSVSFFS